MSRRRILLTFLLVVAIAAGAAPADGAPVPGTSCRLLPADNIWNTDISSLPIHPKSAVWKRSMDSPDTLLHPDFGGPYGLPFAVVGAGHRKRKISFQYASQSDKRRYPFGPDIPLEGGSDRHALIVNRATCTLYELFAADWNDGRPRAGSGAIFDLTSNALRPDGWTSADAAGLPILPGLVRYDEVKAGRIAHAIRFTAELTQDRHLWPARHDAGHHNPKYPPMGARFRLRSSYPLRRFGRDARVILRAMKQYGVILADNGSNWYFQGATDDRWTDSLLDQLKSVPARAFEAVDVSACKVSSDSGKADCPA